MALNFTSLNIKYLTLIMIFAFAVKNQSAYAWCVPNCLPGVVHISAGSDCEPTIHASQLLSNYQYNCSSYQVTVYQPSGAPIGNTVPSHLVGQVLNYSVFSGGTVCMGSLKVIDNYAPVAICDLSTRVSLGSNGTARVYVSAFDDGSYDNCGVESIKIARKKAGNCPYGVKSDTEFRSFVEVCCNDIYKSPLEIKLKVTDYSGNTNVCWSILEVEDKLTPAIVCPPNINVSCEFDYDHKNLSVFGKVVKEQKDRDLIVINDPNYAPTFIAGIDGIATGACGVTISETAYDDLECGIGTIVRTFTATSKSGMTGSCVQKIKFTQTSPFTEDHIIWPDHVHITECPHSGTDPEMTGEPKFIGSACSKPVASYRDLVFTIVEEGCFKILRRWTVLDWCYFDPNAEPPIGMWTYTQAIKVQSIEAPLIEKCDPIVVYAEDVIECSGYIELTNSAMDNCTPDSLLKWSYVLEPEPDDLDVITGQTPDASGYYPFGTHTIRWMVEDLCGNKRVCDQEFTIKDGKQPTPVCYHGLSSVVMPASGEITLAASVFDANSFDNCTEKNKLTFAYSDDAADSLKTFTCDNLDTTFVEIYVFDEEGNSDFCSTYIVIGDNYFKCSDSLMTITAGMVTDIHGDPVQNVNIHFDSEDMPGVYDAKSWFNGYYELDWYGVHPGSKGWISGSKRDDYLNGVTTLDLLLIQQHILGKESFRTNTQFLAADINGDGQITLADILEAQQLILGNIDAFHNNDSWLVFPAEEKVFRSGTGAELSEAIEIDLSRNQITLQNFEAIKVGDINFSAIGSPPVTSERHYSKKELFYQMEEANGSVRLELSFEEGTFARSLQFTLELGVSPEDISAVHFSDDLDLNWQYNLLPSADGELLAVVSVYSDAGFYFSENPFLTLEFKEESIRDFDGSVKLASAPAPSEIAADLHNTQQLELEWKDETGREIIDLSQMSVNAYPNPGSGPLAVEIHSVADTDARIEIRDALGRVIHRQEVDLLKGLNQFTVEEAVLAGSGMYLIRVSESGGESKTVKVLRH